MNFIENFTSELVEAGLDANLVLATFYKSVAMTQKHSTFHILSKEEKSMLDSALFEKQCANEYEEITDAPYQQRYSDEEYLDMLYLRDILNK